MAIKDDYVIVSFDLDTKNKKKAPNYDAVYDALEKGLGLKRCPDSKGGRELPTTTVLGPRRSTWTDVGKVLNDVEKTIKKAGARDTHTLVAFVDSAAARWRGPKRKKTSQARQKQIAFAAEHERILKNS